MELLFTHFLFVVDSFWPHVSNFEEESTFEKTPSSPSWVLSPLQNLSLRDRLARIETCDHTLSTSLTTSGSHCQSSSDCRMAIWHGRGYVIPNERTLSWLCANLGRPLLQSPTEWESKTTTSLKTFDEDWRVTETSRRVCAIQCTKPWDDGLSSGIKRSARPRSELWAGQRLYVHHKGLRSLIGFQSILINYNQFMLPSRQV